MTNLELIDEILINSQYKEDITEMVENLVKITLYACKLKERLTELENKENNHV